MRAGQDTNNHSPVGARLQDDRPNPTALLDTIFIDSIPFDSPNTLLQDRLLSRAYLAAHGAQCVQATCHHTAYPCV